MTLLERLREVFPTLFSLDTEREILRALAIAQAVDELSPGYQWGVRVSERADDILKELK
jgi:hypothetical protein